MKIRNNSHPRVTAEVTMSEAAGIKETYRSAATTAELVAAVKAHAMKHYDDGGWDVVVEAMTDEDIVAAIGWATTPTGAIGKMRTSVSVWAERQADAVISAF
jgi:hypothetical protein